MKRTLTSIAAASMVLGTLVPVAFAATSTAGLSKAGQLPIVVNGSVLSNPFEMTGVDSGNTTGFFPLYYFNQALTKVGFSATWNGNTWAITAPGVTPAPVAGGVGTGNTTVTVNGTVVKKFNTQAAKDPAAGPSSAPTTYLPVYYINNVLTALGVTGTFSGQTGLSVAKAAAVGIPALSAVTATGGTTGTGSATSPAVSLNGTQLKLSTTLTDANGNPVPNTQVTFEFSNYGQVSAYLPTVYDVNNDVVAGSTSGNNETYQVFTNASGVATISVAGPSGQTYAYQVKATAPYQNASGQTLTSGSGYVEYVASNQAGIAPLATNLAPYKTTLGSSVPVSVILPANASGQPSANELVQFSTNAGYFTNASGADLGTTVSVATNSAGLAQVLLDGSAAATATVIATNPNGFTPATLTTYIEFTQAGVPAKVANVNTLATQYNINQNVTISGTLEDSAGNVVPNGQVLAVGASTSGHLSYVSGSTTTKFPAVTVNSTSSVPANSSYGNLVTADANGNFTLTVVDTKADSGSTVSLYPVLNGETDGASISTSTITTVDNGTYSVLAVSPIESGLSNNNTSVTGLLGAADGSTVTPVWIEPQDAAGNAVAGQSFTYNVSVSNSGKIASVNGTTLTNQVNATTVTESYSGGVYTISVPGQTVTTLATGEDIELGITNKTPGDTKVSVVAGSQTATADITFGSGAQTQVANFSPAAISLGDGASQTFTYTVEDAQGNPVTGGSSLIKYDPTALTGAWITAVNGVTLSEGLGANGVSEPTPIPLSSTSGLTNQPKYGSVYVNGVVSWTQPGLITVYPNAKGVVTLTIQNGEVGYFGTDLNVDSSGVGAASGSTAVWTYGDNTNSTKGAIYFGTNQNGANTYYGTSSSDNSTNIGTIGW